MTAVVLDAATAVSWIVRSQSTAAAQAVLEDQEITAFEVPSIFPVELRNALLKLERQGKSDAALTNQGIEMVERLNMQTRAYAGSAANDKLLALARTAGLSFYDAHYLDLAEQRGLLLVARDRALLAAAIARGVPVRSTLAPS